MTRHHGTTCEHGATIDFCHLCTTLLASMSSTQVGEWGTTDFSHLGRPPKMEDKRPIFTGAYASPTPPSKRGPPTGPSVGFNSLLESELATMSGCILALSEHSHDERARILRTMGVYYGV